MDDSLGLPQDAFAKLDAEEDEVFYQPPRLVCHIDDGVRGHDLSGAAQPGQQDDPGHPRHR